MDDLLFRRSIYADPKCSDEEVRAAIDADPAKQKFAQEIEELDQRIASALCVAVPDDLCEKLILRQSLASHQQQKKKGRIQLAIAASFTLALGVIFNYMQYSHAYDTIGDYAIAHVEHEAQYFTNNIETRVSLSSLNQKMASFNGAFSEDLGELMAANFCRFDGMKSLHLVFKGKESPVNVFIVPNSKHLTLAKQFSNDNLSGVVNNFEDSNIVVVGDKSEALSSWQERINSKVRWST